MAPTNNNERKSIQPNTTASSEISANRFAPRLCTRQLRTRRIVSHPQIDHVGVCTAENVAHVHVEHITELHQPRRCPIPRLAVSSLNPHTTPLLPRQPLPLLTCFGWPRGVGNYTTAHTHTYAILMTQVRQAAPLGLKLRHTTTINMSKHRQSARQLLSRRAGVLRAFPRMDPMM